MYPTQTDNSGTSKLSWPVLDMRPLSLGDTIHIAQGPASAWAFVRRNRQERTWGSSSSLPVPASWHKEEQQWQDGFCGKLLSIWCHCPGYSCPAGVIFPNLVLRLSDWFSLFIVVGFFFSELDWKLLGSRATSWNDSCQMGQHRRNIS